MTKLKHVAIQATALLIFSGVPARAASIEENKKTVVAFYEMAFNEHKPVEAMQIFVGKKYIQHNPFVGDGKQPFIDFFSGFQKQHPAAHVKIKRVVAEKDLIVLHVHSMLDKQDRGRAVMDIFRIEDGKIVEHWDVGQVIPEKSPNDNTMF